MSGSGARKYAIFHFLVENSAGIGKTDLIHNFTDKCQEGDRVWVFWQNSKEKKGKKYLAEVKKFGRSDKELQPVLDALVARIAKEKEKASNKIQGPAKKAKITKEPTSAALLSKVKDIIDLKSNDDEDEPIEDILVSENRVLRKENQKLKEEVAQLRLVLLTMEGLPDLIQKMNGLREAAYPTVEPRRTHLISTSDSSSASSSNGSIPGKLIERCSNEDPRKFTNEIMQGLYTQEWMASHSMMGAPSSTHSTGEAKPAMPSAERMAIIDEVIKRFPGRKVSDVRGYIRQMFNNAAKSVKKKKAKLAAAATNSSKNNEATTEEEKNEDVHAVVVEDEVEEVVEEKERDDFMERDFDSVLASMPPLIFDDDGSEDCESDNKSHASDVSDL